jgi:hypothetical protein
MRSKVFIILGCLVTLLSTAWAQEGPQVKAYGFVVVNARYNTDCPADIPITIAAADTFGSFLITARQTRFGLNIKQNYDKFNVVGEIEVDFYGLSGSSPAGGVNQSAIRLRLANVKLQFKNVALTMGQAWSLFQPYFPKSVAQLAILGLSSAGNLWNRFPQVRLDYAKNNLTLQAAVLRPFGADVTPNITQGDQIGSGEKSEMPFFQARAAVKAGAVTVGVSGHFGKEDYPSADINTQAIAGDLLIKAGKATITAEGYAGENLPMFFSSVKTQTNPATNKIEAQSGKGGWGELSLKLSPKITFDASGGMEDVEDGLIKNTAGIVNLMYDLQPNLTIAGEVSTIKTERKNLDDCNNVTVNLGCKFNF